MYRAEERLNVKCLQIRVPGTGRFGGAIVPIVGTKTYTLQ